MGVVHLSRLVSNYVFLRAESNVTKSVRINRSFPAYCWGMANYYTFDISPTLPNSVSGPWLCPPRNHTVMGLYGRTDQPTVLKGNWLVLNITVKTGSRQVLNRRVDILVEQVGNTSRQAINRNLQGSYSNR